MKWIYALSTIITLLLLRSWLNISANLELHYDEAQYWEWSRALDWGYYSKGPIVAWLIAVSETIFGHGEWQTRLFAWLAHAMLILIIYCWAKNLWQSVPAARWAASLTLTTPLFFSLGQVMTTDILLLIFWAIALWSLYRALFENRSISWYSAGIAVGLGALTKLSIGLLPLTVGLYVIFSSRLRSHLRNPHLWWSLVIMTAIMSPMLWWNAQHDWVLLRHELGHVDDQAQWSLGRSGEYLISQIIALSPLIVILAFLVLRKKPGPEGHRFLWHISLAWCLFFLLKAFMGKVQLNWPSPSYIGLFILLSGHLPTLSKPKKWLGYTGILSSVALIAMTFFTHPLGLKPSQDPLKDMNKWREPVMELYKKAGDIDFIFTPFYRLTAEIAYYWPEEIPAYVIGRKERRFNQHDLWPSINTEAGKNGVFVNGAPGIVPPTLEAFDHCKALAPIVVYDDWGREIRTLYGHVCKQLKPIEWPKPSFY